MEIRIGIQNSPREISFETSRPAAELESLIAASLAEKTGYLKIGDDKGNVYIVPTASVAYIELGSEESRRIGFVG